MSRKSNAFTLIELLVVISIIALLLSILMPALSKVKEQSRRVVCGADLKQIGTLLSLYCMDNRNTYMPFYSGWYHSGSCNYDMNNDGKLDVTGLLPLMPYLFKAGVDSKGQSDVQRMKIFWCPSGKNNGINQYNDFQWKSTAFANFGYNQYCSRTYQLCEWGGRTQTTLEHSPLKSTDRGSWITFADICYLGVPGTGTIPVESNHSQPTTIGRQTVQKAITAAGGNSLHVDSHVEWNRSIELNDTNTNIKVILDPATQLGNPAFWLYPRTR